MRSVLKTGECVSCGRESGRYYRVCPYCGEQVWQPAWRRAACLALLVLPPLLSVTLAVLTEPDLAVFARAFRTAHAFSGCLLAAGAGLLCLPCADDDLVVSSRSELRWWQAQAVGGSMLCGMYAAVTAFCLCFGRTVGVGAWLSGLVTFACVAAAPLFFRVPWRALIAGLLILAAVMLQRCAV